jgi:F-type H+-transporting ATPase subunit delta
MLNPRLATRYAKSLIDLSRERKELDAVFEDMLLLQRICSGNRDFVVLLRSPVIPPDKKIKIVEAVTKGKVSKLTDGFFRLLIKKGRESNLPEVITAFIEQYKKFKNIYTATLTTATPISEGLKKTIINRIRATTEMQHVEMETIVKEDIIGGFVLQIGDQLVDGSILYELKEVARQFENNDFIYKVR